MNEPKPTEPTGTSVRSSELLGHPGYREPIISLDRMSKRFACFDGFEIVRDFQSYASEKVALAFAHDWFKARTIHVPQVVFPMVRKMKVS